MTRIDVETVSDDNGCWTFEVTVSEGGGRTGHRVTLSAATYERLSGGRCPPEEFVRRSFEFLLEREPKESILSEFDVSVISRYFPEYEVEIAERMGGG